MTTLFIRLLCAASVATPAAGCRLREAPPPGEEERPGALLFDLARADRDLELVYADLVGTFRIARSIAEVPSSARRVVRVIDPTAGARGRGDDEPVAVVDLSGPGEGGLYRGRLESRDRFERLALASLPPGPGSRLPLPAAAAGPSELVPEDRVVLYSASWCGASRRARDFLRERRVDFVERDVERDPAAAAELAARAAEVDARPDRVPVIDVRGRLVIGFEPARLETLLGEQT